MPISLTGLSILATVAGIIFNGIYEPFFSLDLVGVATQLLLPGVVAAIWLSWIWRNWGGHRSPQSRGVMRICLVCCVLSLLILSVCPYLYVCDLFAAP